ncbi:major capsid protein [Shouchella lehensis]|uniref:Phage capsid protein n=1 Tax=Shouchella lehensis TaxID=300825 RepID=A0A4Y7WIK3_9BACI|nr:major capsid protein [Shouchella lehensis]MBG9785622.1 phage major capsid protein E [Shouchella lehensis]TES48076.1 phage capsid protein [Shouchella lehensis]
MDTIFDLVTAQNIGTYYTNNPSNSVPYLGATLFPAKKQLGLDLSWIKGANGLPVALEPSAFDTKANVRDRIGFNKVQTEMPFFREAMHIGEKMRQELNKLQGSAQASLYQPIINNIFDDVTTLVRGARVQPERMIMQLLSTGTIDIQANRQDYTYDYDMKEDHKETLTGGARWSQADATPMQDIQKWQDDVENNTGVRPTRAVMTRKTFGYLLANKSIRSAIQPLGGENIFITEGELKQFIQTKLGVSIAVYNKKFIDEAGQNKSFYEDDKVTLIPEGNLGNTYYGTTPEESDLMTGQSVANVSIVDTGVAITTLKEAHPVNVQTIVSAITLPSFETIDNIFIAKVN